MLKKTFDDDHHFTRNNFLTKKVPDASIKISFSTILLQLLSTLQSFDERLLKQFSIKYSAYRICLLFKTFHLAAFSSMLHKTGSRRRKVFYSINYSFQLIQCNNYLRCCRAVMICDFTFVQLCTVIALN